jgi:hypothetical protein
METRLLEKRKKYNQNITRHKMKTLRKLIEFIGRSNICEKHGRPYETPGWFELPYCLECEHEREKDMKIFESEKR